MREEQGVLQEGRLNTSPGELEIMAGVKGVRTVLLSLKSTVELVQVVGQA